VSIFLKPHGSTSSPQPARRSLGEVWERAFSHEPDEWSPQPARRSFNES